MPTLAILTVGVLFFGALSYWAGRLRVPPESKYHNYAVEFRATQRRLAGPALVLGVVMAAVLIVWAVAKYA